MNPYFVSTVRAFNSDAQMGISLNVAGDNFKKTFHLFCNRSESGSVSLNVETDTECLMSHAVTAGDLTSPEVRYGDNEQSIHIIFFEHEIRVSLEPEQFLFEIFAFDDKESKDACWEKYADLANAARNSHLSLEIAS